MLYGIDISHHQSDGTPFPLTADVVRSEKLSFVICKATQGWCKQGTWRRAWNFRDGWFERHVRASRRAGVPVVGAYHYLLAETGHTGSGRRQAEFFVRAVERLAPNGTGLLLAVDFERSDWTKSLGAPEDFSPRWRDLKGFITRFRELVPTHPLLLYTARGYAGRIHGDIQDLDRLTLAWTAEWPDVRAAPGIQTYRGALSRVGEQRAAGFGGWTPDWGGFSRTTILQFTNRAAVAGRHVDGNAFDGDLAALRALTDDGMPLALDVTGRPAYRKGYNRVLKAALDAARTADVGTGNAAFLQGVTDARVRVARRLKQWQLKGGNEA